MMTFLAFSSISSSSTAHRKQSCLPVKMHTFKAQPSSYAARSNRLLGRSVDTIIGNLSRDETIRAMQTVALTASGAEYEV